MKLDLSQVDLPGGVADYHVEEVLSHEQAEMYAHVHCDIIGFPGLLERKIQWAKKQLSMASPDAINYIVRIDGYIAGACSLLFNKAFTKYQAGGVYNAGVYEAYRRKGIGMAMACHRITVAQQHNLDSLSIVLMSDAMARGYCERLGFSNHAQMTPYFVE